MLQFIEKIKFSFERYMRRDGTMRLADFVSAILHLTMAFELFKSKDTNQDNLIKMNLNEVTNRFLFFHRGKNHDKLYSFILVD